MQKIEMEKILLNKVIRVRSFVPNMMLFNVSIILPKFNFHLPTINPMLTLPNLLIMKLLQNMVSLLLQPSFETIIQLLYIYYTHNKKKEARKIFNQKLL